MTGFVVVDDDDGVLDGNDCGVPNIVGLAKRFDCASGCGRA